ncbi:hypothetical protein K492DRAFT_210256 [Lichtheimia hyalospora FSU 10163]|nr:hypothetical protein K492DRAFT_210256 [Lichtheimia hyalospora FSU 10163]
MNTEQPPSTMATNFAWEECGGGWFSGTQFLCPPPLTPPSQHHSHNTSFPTSCFLSPETTAAGVMAENCPPTPPQQSTALFQESTESFCPPVPMNNNTTAANVTITSPMSVHPTIAVPSPQSREASPRSNTPTSSMTGSNTTSTAGRKRRSMHDDDDDEQRKKLLERNRLAASKCRQKKKQWVQDLENKSEQVVKKNQELHSMLAGLREECLQLRNELLAHGNCGCSLVQTYLRRSSAELTCINNNRHEPATAAATTVADMVQQQHPMPSTTTV